MTSSIFFYVLLILWTLLLGYKIVNPFNNLVHRIMGFKIVHIVGTDSAIDGEEWNSWTYTDKNGNLLAWRYPSTRTGQVVLNSDGTGYYCGAVAWKFI